MTMSAWSRLRRVVRAWPAVVLAPVIPTSCSSGPDSEDAQLPPGAPTVVVTMRDYGFDYPPEIPAGRVVFRVVNDGQSFHRLTMVPLPEDVPPIKEQLRSTERRFLAPFAGIPDRPPGGIGSFAVDLAPGVRYAMVCFVVDPDGQNHAVKGMSAEFRAGAT